MSTTPTIDERFDNLDKVIAEGRLIRKAWVDFMYRDPVHEDELIVHVCLLAAISPEAASGEDATYCPAEVIPQWWAHLAPPIDDRTSVVRWHDIIKRWASVTRRAAKTLSGEQWRALEFKCGLALIDEFLTEYHDMDLLNEVREMYAAEVNGTATSNDWNKVRLRLPRNVFHLADKHLGAQRLKFACLDVCSLVSTEEVQRWDTLALKFLDLIDEECNAAQL